MTLPPPGAALKVWGAPTAAGAQQAQEREGVPMGRHLVLAATAVVTALAVVAVSSTDASAATRRPLVLVNSDRTCGRSGEDNGRIQVYRATDLRNRRFNNCADRAVNRSRTFWVLENNRDYRARDVCIRPRSRVNLTPWRFGNLISNVYVMPGKTRRQKRNFCRRFTSDGIIGRHL